jgi:hypothetical protein
VNAEGGALEVEVDGDAVAPVVGVGERGEFVVRGALRARAWKTAGL